MPAGDAPDDWTSIEEDLARLQEVAHLLECDCGETFASERAARGHQAVCPERVCDD